MQDFLSIFDVYFMNIYSYQNRSCTWNLKKLCNGDIVINEKDKCWDIVAYNRFFYDDEKYQYDINDKL